MSWRSDWVAIYGEIEGLTDATNVFLRSQMVQKGDGYGTRGGILIPHASRIFDRIEVLLHKHRATLPEDARRVTELFLESKRSYFKEKAPSNDASIQYCLSSLIVYSSEFRALTNDTTIDKLRLTDRAFVHLQRLIAVDPTVRSNWLRAFDQGETHCESLGHVHLLIHGVWSFKLNSSGERTDLMMADGLLDERLVERAAQVLVLTEWKIVKREAELSNVAEIARRQASLYVLGSLAGIELSNYRYLVFVSKKRLNIPSDIDHEGVRWRHVNIAVDPDNPSIAARQ